MRELIYSLHDFLIMTKGISVLLAIGFTLLFIVFWKFLTDKEDEGKKRLEPDDYDVLQDLGPTWFIKDFIYKLFGRSPKNEG